MVDGVLIKVANSDDYKEAECISPITKEQWAKLKLVKEIAEEVWK